MLTISTAENKTFDFVIEGSETVYSLPLAMNLPLSELRKVSAIAALPDGEEKNIAAIDMQLNLLEKYMGEVAGTLTGAQVQAIFEGWNDASGGAELGE